MLTTSPEQITNKGEEIYNKNRENLEREHMGEYVAINVDTEELFIDATPEGASRKAKERHPDTISFLTRIGPDRGVYTLRTCRGQNDNWPFSQIRLTCN